MQDLIRQYSKALYQVNKAKETAPEDEQRILGSMASDLQYALEWMKTARRPGNRRGIERRAAYQRDRLLDPVLMQRYFRSQETEYGWDEGLKEDVVSEWDRVRIEEALSTLTDREREVYLMSRGYCLSYGEIARYLVISKSAVQIMVERAEKKIERQVHESLFCLHG
ncbi:sigma factor-like helix-turn-helix DNA-binding protein [Bacillus sp. OTU530]|uniref:sigma factor-like helix-turn-helix DNA-binding protein n=1 Tax=Bacillus sp. OTU530 TaxID=3043862 RepID=UPI00313D882D